MTRDEEDIDEEEEEKEDREKGRKRKREETGGGEEEEGTLHLGLRSSNRRIAEVLQLLALETERLKKALNVAAIVRAISN